MPVYLIGAGPGDPDLITLKAVKALNKADVVLYDYLANEEILKHAPEDAKRIYVGKKAGEHYKTQDEINQLIIEEAKEHENVIRLKGGDPFVFGSGGEELLALAKENIDFEVIPGVTSAIGAPTSMAFPITHRAVATSFMPKTLSDAMGIALYGMFIAIIIPPAKKSKSAIQQICSYLFILGLSVLSSK